MKKTKHFNSVYHLFLLSANQNSNGALSNKVYSY